MENLECLLAVFRRHPNPVVLNRVYHLSFTGYTGDFDKALPFRVKVLQRIGEKIHKHLADLAMVAATMR